MRTAAGAGPGVQRVARFGEADLDTTRETGVVGHEAVEQRLIPRPEDADVRPATGASAGDDEVPRGRHADPSMEGRVVRHEAIAAVREEAHALRHAPNPH